MSDGARTLKNTTQKFLSIAVLPLDRRYPTDRVFTNNTLQGKLSCDKTNRRQKSIDGNYYAQVFPNKYYFYNVYPKAGDDLKLFCQEFGVPEKLKFDGLKEHACKGTTFMKEVLRKGIDYHIIETDLHNYNTVEGVIREVRWKGYRTMVKKRVPR